MKPTIARLLPLLLAGAALTGCAGVDYSPDGTKLAFTWPLGDKVSVAMMDVDGSGFKYLSSVEAMVPKWAPDNRRIAVTSGEGVSILDSQTGKSTLVVPDGGPVVAWSEDGRKLATLAPGPEGSETTQIVWYDFDAEAITLRSTVKGLESNSDVMPHLVWIPRTSGLALVADVNDASDVYLMEAGETKRITTTGDVIGLALEPGGKRLVWARKSRNAKYILMTLYAFDLVQRSAQRLPFPERVPTINPDPRTGPGQVEWVSFSPTLDRMLLFTTSGVKDADDLIYSVNRSGTHSAIVGRGAANKEAESTVHIAWSPDGAQMTGLWFSETSARLETRNADGSSPRTLKRSAGF